MNCSEAAWSHARRARSIVTGAGRRNGSPLGIDAEHPARSKHMPDEIALDLPPAHRKDLSRWHRTDAGRHRPVLDQRRARQVAARRPIRWASFCSSAAPPRSSCSRRSCGRPGSRRSRPAPRPGLQIVRVVLSTLEVAMFFWAVSYLPLADTVTFYLAGPIYVTALSVDPARRAGRLAALDRRAGRLCRRDAGDAPDRGEPHAAGADRAHRQRVLFAADDHHAPAARDIEYGADRRADRRHAAVRRRARAVAMGHAVAARLRAAVAVRRASRSWRSPASTAR